jgi:hypothetical protein
MINRFDWAKAVRRQATEVLSDRAKMVAAALAYDFCNDQTGQINPSLATLAEATGKSVAAVQRGLKELIGGGWIVKTTGRGRSNRCHYVLSSPGNVVAIRPVTTAQAKGTTEKVAAKSSQDCKYSAPKVAAKVNTSAKKTDHFCTSHIMQEQKKEQKKGARPTPHLSVVVEAGGWKALEWNKWLSDLGTGVQLRDLTALHVKGGYSLPWNTPPSRHAETQCRIAMNIIEWAKGQGHAHAA